MARRVGELLSAEGRKPNRADRSSAMSAEPTTNPRTDLSTGPRLAIGRTRLRWRILAGLVLVTLSLAVAGWAIFLRGAPASLDRATELLEAKKYNEASREAERLVEDSPEDPRVLILLARARAGAKDLAGCIDALKRVPDWSVRKDDALFREGQIFNEQKRGRDAEKAFLTCVARDSKAGQISIQARLQLMALYAKEERIEAFKAISRELLNLLPEAEQLPVMVMRMKIEFEQTLPSINAESLRAMVDADPGDHQARAGLATALDRMGDQVHAQEHFAKALAQGPNDLELRERYLSFLQRVGNRESIHVVLAARNPLAENRPVIQKFLGWMAEMDGDLRTAESAYRKAVDGDPTQAEAHHRLAQVLYRQDRKAEAEAHSEANARLNEARQELHKAWNPFADQYEKDPEHLQANLLVGIARACEAAGWTEEAGLWHRQAMRIGSESSRARNGLDRLNTDPRS
jgi:tetratricopeptide (TPR) repeat protein